MRYNRDTLSKEAGALLFTACIFAVLPLSPGLWKAMSENAPGFMAALAVPVPLLVAGTLAVVLCLGRRIWSASPVFGATSALLLIALILWFGDTVANRFHIAQYAVLGFLVCRSIGDRFGRPASLLLSLGYVLAIGFLDEQVQAFLPNRVYDPMDIVVNWASALVGVLAFSAYSVTRSVKAPDAMAIVGKGGAI